MLQRDSAGVPGGVVEKLRGHAGADAGREGFSGDCIWMVYLMGRHSSNSSVTMSSSTLPSGYTHLPRSVYLCVHLLYLCVSQCIYMRYTNGLFVPAQVQLSLYTYLSSEFIGTATIYTTIRRVGTVLQLMHTLKYYYWATNPLECSGITPKGLGMFMVKPNSCI
ncbi:hypothetical protein XENOCAPTIV_000457 [Xenoophorus captivus]|uniref:DUF4704 domain-containing protein n=1 Tax=Xenoophorus captivus TaxID=1517983 RepID=A0ABV0RNN0_9TELE